MAKYAVIIIAGQPYFAGLNAILNALDYYQIKDIDVHFGSSKNLVDGYYNYVKDKFSYHIEAHCLEDLCEVKKLHDHEFLASKYGIALKIKDRYDAILHLSARCCPVDDISKYFTVAEKTGYLLCPENPRFKATSDKMKIYEERGDLDGACRSVPIINFVFFHNPKYHTDLLEYMWERRFEFRKIIESNRNPHDYKPSPIYLDDTHLFIKAVWELKKWEQVFYLPNISWVPDYGMMRDRITLHSGNSLLYDVGERIKVTYGRFYYNIRYNVESPFPETEEEKKNSIIYQNAMLMLQLFHFLNYEYKVSLDQVREIPGDYNAILSNIP